MGILANILAGNTAPQQTQAQLEQLSRSALTPAQREGLISYIKSTGGMLAKFLDYSGHSDSDLIGQAQAVNQARAAPGDDAWGSFLAPMLAGGLVGGGALGSYLGEGGATLGTTGTLASESPMLLADAGITATDVGGGMGAVATAPEASLGTGITAGTTTGAVGGGALGSGLTAGTTTGAVGGGALGSGVGAGAGGVAGLAAAGSPALGALGTGSLAGETLYPATGGLTAAAGATGAGIASGVGNGGGAATTAGASAAGGSALSRILDGTASTADWLSVGGSLGAAGLGVYGANQQTNLFKDLADRNFAIGAPSRARYEGSYAPGFTMSNDPGYTDALDQSAKATLHGLSVQGNPAGSPNAWASSLQDLYSKTAYPALQNYRNTNASSGGFTTALPAANAAGTNAIGSNANVVNAIGAGAADIFNPPKSLAQILREARVG